MENKYVIFDTHAHYDNEAFNEDRENIFRQIKGNGVIGVPSCASSYESISKASKLTLENDFIYGALGIHPGNANEFSDDVGKKNLDLTEKNKKIIAIEEIGLGYYWDENPSKDIQKKVFRQQVKLAEKLSLPVVIHDKEAHGGTLEIIKEFPSVKGVVHCFLDGTGFAMGYIKHRYCVGVTGIVTLKNAKKIVEVVKHVPLEELLVETDCPYIVPIPNRGKRNKSDYIAYIIEQIAIMKELNPKKVNLAVNDNFKRLIKNNL